MMFVRPRAAARPFCRVAALIRRWIAFVPDPAASRWRGVACFLMLAAGVLSGGSLRVAAASSVAASIEPPVITAGEAATLTLNFTGITPGAHPQVPAISNLTITAAGQSFYQSFVNGAVMSSVAYTYSVSAAAPGDFTLPPMSFTLGGQTVRSQPLRLRVNPASRQYVNPADGSVVAAMEIFVAKTNVYVGEPIPVEVRLFAVDGRLVQHPQLPADGCTVAKLSDPVQSRTTYQGRPFNQVTFRTLVTPTKPGVVTLGPASMPFAVPIPGRRQMGFFDGPPMRQVQLSADPVSLRVLSIPQPAPATFRGALGSYQLTVTASPTNVAVGDPITVRIRVSGSGVIEGLQLPAQPAWRDFKVYPPGNPTVTKTDPFGRMGTAVFEQVVVPENHEIKVLPGFQLTTFDTESGRYVPLSGPAIPLTVRPAGGAAVALPAPVATNSTEAAAPTDVLHIKADPGAAGTSGPPWVTRPWVLALQCVPVLLWAGFLGRRLLAESRVRNPRLTRRRTTEALVRAGLLELRQQAAAGEAAGFYATTVRVLQEQIGERLGVPAAGITESVIDTRLRPAGLPAETAAALHELFQVCNRARYAPGAAGQEPAALIPRIEAVLRELQRLEVAS